MPANCFRLRRWRGRLMLDATLGSMARISSPSWAKGVRLVSQSLVNGEIPAASATSSNYSMMRPFRELGRDGWLETLTKDWNDE